MPFSTIEDHSNVANQAAKFYLDQLQLPVAPSTWSITTNGQNVSDSLTDGRAYTYLRKGKAQNMSLEYIHPITYQPHIMDSEEPIKTYTDFYWNKQTECEPMVLTIIYADGTTFNHAVMLDNWDYQQDADYGSDWKFKLDFTEYIPAQNRQLVSSEFDSLVPQGNRDSSRILQ